MSIPTSRPFDDVLAGVRADALVVLQQDTKHILDTVRGRIEYAESRRSQLAAVAGVLLAAGIAALTQILKGGFSYFPAFVGLLVGSCAVTVAGALVLLLYGGQTNWSYPFKQKTSTWKWFYRDALPNADDVEPPWHTRQDQKLIAASQTLFDDDRAEFATKMASLSDRRVSLAQDLQQIYVMHWNEFYKNKFLTHLRKALIGGVIAALAAGLLAFFVALIFDADAYAHKKSGPARHTTPTGTTPAHTTRTGTTPAHGTPTGTTPTGTTPTGTTPTGTTPTGTTPTHGKPPQTTPTQTTTTSGQLPPQTHAVGQGETEDPGADPVAHVSR